MDKEKYTYKVVWSHPDETYIGTVAEFPHLSHIDNMLGGASFGIVSLVGAVLADMEQSGEVPPKPFGERNYSGKLSLRMTPEQHRRIAIEAAEQNVSINHLLTSRL